MSNEEVNLINSLAEISPPLSDQVVNRWMMLLGQAYLRPVEEMVVIAYREALSDCRPERLEKAFKLSLTRSEFFPTVAKILECYEMIVANESKTYYTPEPVEDEMTDDEKKEFGRKIREWGDRKFGPPSTRDAAGK